MYHFGFGISMVWWHGNDDQICKSWKIKQKEKLIISLLGNKKSEKINLTFWILLFFFKMMMIIITFVVVFFALEINSPAWIDLFFSYKV